MQRKTIIALALASLLTFPCAVSAANGGFQGPQGGMGGFQGPTSAADADTVAKALKCWDDAPVTLTGNIVERLAGSDDKYMFRDATGQVMVDIDEDLFIGRTVTPQTKVRLHGKVDKEIMEPTKIDVKRLEIIP